VLNSHAPNSHEIAARPQLADVQRIIDEWLLLEYACVFLPSNQSALVEAVSKGDRTESLIPFMPIEEVERELHRRLGGLDVTALIEARIQEVYDAARGRV